MFGRGMARNDPSVHEGIGVPERFETALREALRCWRIAPTDDQVRRMRDHLRAVAEANTQFNLTRITEPAEAAIKLYADSLAVVAWAERTRPRVKTVLDAGTGAGFPAVPVAVMQPRWAVLAVDSTGKKVRFVESCARDLAIANLTAQHVRVEHLHLPPTYDLVLFKAVEKMDACLKWSQHIVSRGGCVVLYKTPDLPEDEEHAGRRSADRIGYTELDRFDYTLTWANETLHRTLRIFRRR
jgi:16S rRNA (guanine527-N7)-methyltransferase